MLRRYEPGTESYEKYETRVRKQAAALTLLDAELPKGKLEELLAEASYRRRLYDEAGSDPAKEIALLRREYILEDIDRDGTDGQIARLTVLESLLTERGFDLEGMKRQLGKVSQPSEPSVLPAAGAVPSMPRTVPETPRAPRAPDVYATHTHFGPQECFPIANSIVDPVAQCLCHVVTVLLKQHLEVRSPLTICCRHCR